MKLFSRMLAGIVSAVLLAGILPGNILAEETALYTFFHDKKADSSCWSNTYTDEQGRGGYISEIEDSATAKEGSGSYRIKLATPYYVNSDIKNVVMLHANLVTNPKAYAPAQGDYLTLWYQPLLKREKIEVGIVSENGGKYSMLRVNLLDYADITDSEYADNANTPWKLVKIPMTDFLDSKKAAFYENGTGAEVFNWDRLAGFSVAGSDENIESQINFCRVDEVKIIRGEDSGQNPVDPEQPDNQTIKSERIFFDDAVKDWVNGYMDSEGRNHYISNVFDTNVKKEGEKCWRLKLGTAPAYVNTDLDNLTMLYANTISTPQVCTPGKNTYLEFWYQPMLSRQKIEVGLACGSEKPFGMLRVDLLNYITLSPSDYGNDSVWKKVKIPTTDFLDSTKAVFYENGTGLKAFDWNRVTGFSIAGSDENLDNQKHFCRLDDIKLVEYADSGDPVVPADPKYPEGDVKWSFVDDQLHGWAKTSGNQFVSFISPLDAAAAKVGTVSQRIKLSTPSGYVSNGSMLYANILNSYGAYPENIKSAQYLALWYQPLLKRNKIEVGLACGKDQSFAMLRVNLLDYVDIADSEYADSPNTPWKLVKIPMADFLDSSKAVFYQNGTAFTEFDWNQFAGFSIAGSDEGLQNQLNFCRIDEVKIVGEGETPIEPADPEYPKGREKHVIFHDKKGDSGVWANTIGGAYISEAEDRTPAKEGNGSYRIKIFAPSGYVSNGTMLYVNLVKGASAYTPDREKDYLCLWYQPLAKREKIEVGVVCGKGSPFAMLRVNLLDYVDIADSEYADSPNTPWKLVKIPMADFLDSSKAVFYQNGTAFTEFDWSQFAGFSIAASDEKLSANQQNFCRLDEVKIISCETGGEEAGAVLSKAVFYNGAGSEITGLSGTGSVSAKLTFENTSASPVSDASVVLAVYDNRGTLTKLMMKNIIVPAGTPELSIDPVSISEPDSMVKLIALSSAKGLKPFKIKDGVKLAIVR